MNMFNLSWGHLCGCLSFFTTVQVTMEALWILISGLQIYFKVGIPIYIEFVNTEVQLFYHPSLKVRNLRFRD